MHRTDMGALPFCCLRLTAPVPPDPAYPQHLTTIGDHVRQRRLDRGLTQRQAAGEIGVAYGTLRKWESGDTAEVAIRYWPGVIRFLGYDPMPEPQTLGEKLQAARRRCGLSQEKLAKLIGVHESTIYGWESRGRRPIGGAVRKLKRFLRSPA